jgi:hypothetical protein
MEPMVDDDSDRVEGVDFSDVEPLLEDATYPITAEEVVDEYGDQELERTNAEPITIEELFSYMGDTTFESFEELQQMLLGQMPQDSDGRTNYSDRGGSLPDVTEAAEDAEETPSADL